MKKDKIYLYVIGGGLLIGGGYLLFVSLKKDSEMNDEKKHQDNKPTPTFNRLKDKYPADLLNAAERIYRLETAHFTSKIYKNTFGAGMISTTTSFPYGWTSLTTLWITSNNKPTGLYNSANGFNYIVFPSLEAGVKAVCETLKRYIKTGKNANAYCGCGTGYITKLNAFKDSELITPSINNNIYLN